MLFDAYRAAHPGVTVTNGAVAGGGGSNAQVVLAQRLLSGDPPDVWQTFPAASLRAYVDQGEVADVSDLYGAGRAGRGPAGGHPRRAHRRRQAVRRADQLPPGQHALLQHRPAGQGRSGRAGTRATGPTPSSPIWRSWRAAGVTPLCLGAKDPFTTTALFENTLLGVVGADGWRQIAADRFDWNSDAVDEALTRFGRLLDYADPQAAALTWDAATQKLANGGCAFETLNDSAFGELVSAGAIDGETFGEVPYPGTDGTYVAVVDTFVRARESGERRQRRRTSSPSSRRRTRSSPSARPRARCRSGPTSTSRR